MSKPNKSSSVVPSSIAQLATTVAQAGVGEPLAAKRRRELSAPGRISPAAVQLAIAAYEEHAALLGGDLDAPAVHDALSYVAQVQAVVHGLKAGAQALGDRVLEQRAVAGTFTFTVYERLRAVASLPGGAAVKPQLEAMRAVMKRKRRATPTAPASAPATPAGVSSP